ncbi:uncharacterized protein MCYG_05656 [Microsporum canis CBS 113480]|uniref:Uncharacterized protein n=1 Tax=Arthroderma otae (strain ATCC MYA-4605 / CBS 113480) TaxID=554155 RepID=C5FSI4_ARTOC|nr:uncharacterized protein MCYG_05656 [Microsporum canis CBS 113480]EEQ32837.1 predicted protein [Microsporum canis CBS 113480]
MVKQSIGLSIKRKDVFQQNIHQRTSSNTQEGHGRSYDDKDSGDECPEARANRVYGEKDKADRGMSRTEHAKSLPLYPGDHNSNIFLNLYGHYDHVTQLVEAQVFLYVPTNLYLMIDVTKSRADRWIPQGNPPSIIADILI